MSTRATYLIASTNWDNQKVCFYIHYDGYFEGAAFYFWNMHLCKNNRGLFVGRFIRANDIAEFTLAHEAHGDTEYRYTLEANGDLTAWHINFCDNKWQVVYQGAWYEFVNKYCKVKTAEKLYSFKCSEYSNTEIVMTINELKALIEEKVAYVKKALMDGAIGNAHSVETEVSYFQSQLDQVLVSDNH